MAEDVKVEDVRIGSPCSEPWEEMEGDDKRRFCKVCSKHVFDLSAMTRPQAQRVVDDNGRVCIQYLRAPGGGPRFRPSRRQLVRGFVGSLVTAPMVAVASPAVRTEGEGESRGLIATVLEWLRGPPPEPVELIEIPDRGIMVLVDEPPEPEPEPEGEQPE